MCACGITTLKKALWHKHPATLWVDAKETDGENYFRYTGASFTKRRSQFINLISQGIIALIGAKVKPDRSEIDGHGPAFGMKPSLKRLLFLQKRKFN